MPSLTIRGLSPGLLRALRAAARARHRSLNAQVVTWLDEARRQEAAQGDVSELLHALDRHVRKIRRRQTDSARLIRRVRDAR